MAYIHAVFNRNHGNCIPLYTKISTIPPQLLFTRPSLETLIGYFSERPLPHARHLNDDWNHMSRVVNILTAGLLAAGSSLATAALAEQRPVVVELFTSQGCSSCPPADEILSELGERDDVIAIALHVDYWDYIGWKDEFGSPNHTLRQRGYAAKAERRSIYTPQMIVNGQTDIVGAKPMVLSKAIAKHKEAGARMQLDVQRTEGRVDIRGTVPTGTVTAMDVTLMYVLPSRVSKITRGENRSKTIEYTNIAQNLTTAATWDGQSPLNLSLEVGGDDPLVVIVQEADMGPIVAAARVD
jgi:hypothetical protein